MVDKFSVVLAVLGVVALLVAGFIALLLSHSHGKKKHRFKRNKV